MRNSKRKSRRQSAEPVSARTLEYASPDIETPLPLLKDRWAIVIILLVTLPWWIAATCDFVAQDDGAYVTLNPHVLGGLTRENIAWAFTNIDTAFWFPITWLSLQLDATLFGTGPIGFHATNVAFHIANALLLYWLLRLATRAPGLSLLATLLYAMHPLRVESVAWVTERKDVLFTFFGLWAMLGYVWYTHGKGWKAYLLLMVAYALSLMSKSMLVTLPVLLFLMDFWPLDRWRKVPWRRLILEKVPVAALAAVGVLTTMYVQRATHSLLGTDAYPMRVRIANAFLSYMLYVRDCFYFGRLSFFYPLFRDIPDDVFGVSLILFLGITVAAVVAAWRWRGARPFLVGWAWFVIALLPTIGLVQSGSQSRADRFTYFPAIGLTVGLVFLFPTGWIRTTNLVWARALSASLVVILTVYMTLQLRLWRDPLLLYIDGLEHAGESATLDFAVAFELERSGNKDRALELYLRAIQLAPGFVAAHNNAGALLLQRGQVAKAIPLLEFAASKQPNLPGYQENLKRALRMQATATSPSDK